MNAKAIVTVPPYAPFIREVDEHPLVEGLRLNTVMPVKGDLEDVLRSLKEAAGDKPVYIDLKCRQLRVSGYWIPPYTEVRLSHELSVDTPVTAYFRDGKERATVVAVDGDRLITLEGPKRVVGPGESVNIVDPSLRIEGYFTETDLKYIEAAKKVGITTFMLSFVEGEEDVRALKDLYPEAEVIAKIESQKGLDYVSEEWEGGSRLMAARGDLYLQVERPHNITGALEDILAKDSDAIVASRIFSSLVQGAEPSCADIGDVDGLLRMGYRTFMLGDEVCLQRDSVIGALNLLAAMAERHDGR